MVDMLLDPTQPNEFTVYFVYIQNIIQYLIIHITQNNKFKK